MIVLALVQYILHYISFVSEQSLLHLRSQDSRSMGQILQVLRQASARHVDCETGSEYFTVKNDDSQLDSFRLHISMPKLRPILQTFMEISSPRKVKSSGKVNKFICVK